jgi:hypothetical protein
MTFEMIAYGKSAHLFQGLEFWFFQYRVKRNN